MTRRESKSKKISDLRKQAEKKIPKSVGSIGKRSVDEVKKLVHELQVYQIELEMQNEALKDSMREIEKLHNKYSDLFDHAPIGYFILDKDAFIIETNFAGASLLGFEKGPLLKIKRHFYFFVIPEHFDIFQAHLDTAFASEPKQTCRVKMTKKDKKLFDAVIESIAVRDSKGRFNHYLCAVTDITEIARTEETLRESEALLRALTENSPDAIYVKDTNSRWLMANPAVLHIVGKTAQEALGKTDLELYADPEIGRTILENDQRILRRGRPEAIEEVADTPEGRRTFLSIKAPRRDLHGNIIGIVGISHDLTEQKQADDALRRSEERFRQLANSTFEGILIHDKGVILDVNQALTRLTGYHYEEAIGKTVFTFIAPESWEIVSQRMQRPSVAPFEISLIKKDGTPCLVEVAARDIPYQGKMVRVVALRDITERKQAEEELIRRQTLLEQANKDLEGFSYSVAHDLRAPLRAIDGYVRMLLKKHGHEFDEDSLRKFNVIRSSTHMMGQLIDDLLALSRLGRKQLSMSKIDMEALIRDVWKELQADTPDRNINLTVKNMPPSYGDRTLIKQIYINLLSNAVKFTKYQDPALIEVGGYVEGNDDVYYVKDNGVGFDMTYYDKLFGVFQRLHKADEFEGTGIGLALVQRVIQRHGGRAWAEGKVDGGATFYFSLPLTHTHTHTLDGEPAL